jgi:hypothetical protein
LKQAISALFSVFTETILQGLIRHGCRRSAIIAESAEPQQDFFRERFARAKESVAAVREDVRD